MMSSAPNTLRFPAAAPHQTSAAAPPRMPGLDWLRAGAAVAVVALHAGIPYMTHSLPALEWCVRSSERSAIVDALCWAINVAVMPTFFLMGGALAAGVWKRNPGKAFLVHRTRRLLLPLGFAVLFVLPADMYVWLIGWYTQGLIPWRKVLSIKLASPLSEQFWGVAHLWYLECLWTLSMIAVLIHLVKARMRNSSLSHHVPATPCSSAVGEGRGEGRQPALWLGLLTRPPRPTEGLSTPHKALRQLLLVLTAGLLLALDPTFLIGFQQIWWPGPAAIAFYGLFFAAGWSRNIEKPAVNRVGTTTGAVIQLPSMRPLGAEYSVLSTRSAAPGTRLVLAAALFPLLLLQIHRHVQAPFAGLNLFALTIAYAACSWLAATGLLALARSIKAGPVPKPVAFTAEASFWMYLVHHPLVGLTQLALLNSTIAPAAKFLLSLSTGIGLSLATYAVLVRGSWIGRLLDGRGLAVPAIPSTPPAAEEPIRRAA